MIISNVKKLIVENENILEDFETMQVRLDEKLEQDKNKSEKRILAIDGSYLKTLKTLNKDGLKFSSNDKNYTNSIISGLYDVDKKLIINYSHYNLLDERRYIS